MPSRIVQARVPDDLEAAARGAAPELARLDPSTLVRAALAIVAGVPVGEAVRRAAGTKGRALVPWERAQS